MYDSTPNGRGGGRGRGGRGWGGGRVCVAAAGVEAVWAGGNHKYEYFTVPWICHVAASPPHMRVIIWRVMPPYKTFSAPEEVMQPAIYTLKLQQKKNSDFLKIQIRSISPVSNYMKSIQSKKMNVNHIIMTTWLFDMLLFCLFSPLVAAVTGVFPSLFLFWSVCWWTTQLHKLTRESPRSVCKSLQQHDAWVHAEKYLSSKLMFLIFSNWKHEKTGLQSFNSVTHNVHTDRCTKVQHEILQNEFNKL